MPRPIYVTNLLSVDAEGTIGAAKPSQKDLLGALTNWKGAVELALADDVRDVLPEIWARRLKQYPPGPRFVRIDASPYDGTLRGAGDGPSEPAVRVQAAGRLVCTLSYQRGVGDGHLEVRAPGREAQRANGVDRADWPQRAARLLREATGRDDVACVDLLAGAMPDWTYTPQEDRDLAARVADRLAAVPDDVREVELPEYGLARRLEKTWRVVDMGAAQLARSEPSVSADDGDTAPTWVWVLVVGVVVLAVAILVSS